MQLSADRDEFSHLVEAIHFENFVVEGSRVTASRSYDVCLDLDTHEPADCWL